MTGNERAQHDWFDQELDRLLTGLPDAIDGEDELVQAAVLMQRLDLNQQPEPDDRFILNLEKQLMPNVSHLAVTRIATFQNPIRTIYEQLLSRITIERTQHRRTSRLASAFSIALLFAVIAATAFVAINNGENGDDGSRGATAPAAFQNDDATPSSYQDAGIKWLAPPADGEDVNMGGIAAANDSVYRLISSKSFGGVQALRASDGSILWESPTEWMPIIAADDKGVYFSMRMPDGQTLLVCLDPANGQQRWTVSLPSGVNHIMAQSDSIATLSDESFLQSGLVFVQDWTNQITAIDPILGTTVWQTSLLPTPPESETVVGTPVVSGTMLIAQSNRGTISAMFRINGSVQWTMEGVSGAQFTAVNGVAVIVQQAAQGRDTTTVTGIELVSGKSLWAVEYAGSLSQPIARYDGSTSSVALIVDSPFLAWIDSTSAGPSASPLPQPDSSGFAPKGDAVVAIDLTTGLPEWISGPIPDRVQSIFTRTPSGGQFVVLTKEGRVALIQPTNSDDSPIQLTYVGTGSDSQMQVNLAAGVLGTPVADNSGVFIALADGSIIALDDSGTLSLRD